MQVININMRHASESLPAYKVQFISQVHFILSQLHKKTVAICQ